MAAAAEVTARPRAPQPTRISRLAEKDKIAKEDGLKVAVIIPGAKAAATEKVKDKDKDKDKEQEAKEVRTRSTSWASHGEDLGTRVMRTGMPGEAMRLILACSDVSMP